MAALQTAEPHIGASAISLLQSPQPPPIETILATLLNELTRISHDFMLVLDDYHVIDAGEIHNGVTFVLDQLPPRMHRHRAWMMRG
jgi:LuxR family maltose regulon positive regulatory protein